ncbi:hypothetical protein XF35_42210 [Streptomyces platensis subsp. clarensis]|uniref:Uncharacterized protein n=1 Tax=Streptomyces showdoensis TaxID=68268 RepID=A0A2P2GMM1_STREW|nr:hypothetical protein [Streptomyces showdoensis]KKZ72099.1 hypothetical protein VO63_20185 [Streptomyces showdoensis]MCW7991636.1 hypothetical protein [Streptomyces platensis subsp. clarensis]
MTTSTHAAPAPIPVRPHPAADHRPFITEAQTAAYTAALRAGVTRLTITGWEQQADGSLLQILPTGAALAYSPGTPLTALTPCAAGVRHPHPVATLADLRNAQADAAACTSAHRPPTRPEPTPAVRPLADAFPHGPGADTQPLDVTTLRADHAQEHSHG